MTTPVGTSARPCPEGHGPLRTVRLGPVELDRCTTCEGVFFDRDELTKVAHLAQRARRRPGTRAVVSGSSLHAAAAALAASAAAQASPVQTAVQVVGDAANGVVAAVGEDLGEVVVDTVAEGALEVIVEGLFALLGAVFD